MRTASRTRLLTKKISLYGYATLANPQTEDSVLSVRKLPYDYSDVSAVGRDGGMDRPLGLPVRPENRGSGQAVTPRGSRGPQVPLVEAKPLN